MRVLLTGASGFVGRHLCPALVRDGYTVRALVRAPTNWGPEIKDLVEEFIGDLTCPESLHGAVRNVDVVIHCASLMSHLERLPWSEFYATNVEGTRSLLEACRSTSNKPLFIHISTAFVTGPSSGSATRESAPLVPGPSRYNRSKAAAEEVVSMVHDMPWIILRLPPLYGPGMTYGWPTVMRQIRCGQFRIPGDGNGKMHLTHILDVIDGILLAIRHGSSISGKTYNLAGPKSIMLCDAFAILADVLSAPAPKHISFKLSLAISYVLQLIPFFLKPGNLGLVFPYRIRYFSEDYVYDTSRARLDLGFNPKIDPEQGLRTMASDFLNMK